MLTHVNQGTSLGSYGIDTLPGNSTTMYSGPISLSSFTSTAVEIGSATKGEISGIITPQTSGAYQFGGGGGTLYVDSPLLNTGAATVSVSNPGNSFPLTVYLQGSNTYVGGTTVNDGFLIFNGPSSLPPIGSLTAAGSGSNIGGSYIGYTDLAGLTPTTFLGRFSQANTWGIVGFDSSNVSSPVTITNNIDLTGFNNGVFIGTATAAVLGGSITITPTADDTYRFTAAQNGVLTIDTPLTWGNGVILGSPNFPQYSSGTVIMNGANTYSGGTTINGGSYGLTVGLGTNSAFGGAGGGTVSISAGGLVGIEATAAGIVLPNNITFLDPSPPGSAQLYLRGTNSFTLSGNLTGDSSAGIVLENSSPLTVTLSGNNSGYSGFYSVYNGTLVLSSTSALGNATLNFEGPGTIDLSAAVNPIIQTISGAENNGTLGTLILPSSGTLTFNTTNDTTDNNPTFGGTITGSGGIIVDDTSGGSSGAVVLLYGNNTYSGGTTIVDGGVLAAASNTALGTGPVTLDATSGHGALALDSGVTLTNPLTLTAGFLVGDGTFNPSSLGLAGTITIGPNQGVAGGLPFGNNDIIPGTLNFAGNLAFNTGGAYYWTLQDDSRTDGMSSISVAGNLTINATAGGFTIYAVTFDAGGNKGNPPGSFSLYSPASWTILTTGGTIQNFSASDFTINSTNFDGGVAASHFSLSVNGSDNQLILNFTPVPEPSTWALLATGLGLISVAMIGRRRTAAAL
jgi:autotransporter-associated beta strand protein